jgi:protein TonB
MSSVLEGGEQLERELTPEPVAGPAMGSVVLHVLLGGVIVFYGVFSGLFHHDLWGNSGPGGSMQVTLVSNALPLPSDQPPNQNVLATDTPSQAPAAPSPKQQQRVDETAIPILGRQEKPEKRTVRKTQQHQPQPLQNRAAYGEQAGSRIQQAIASTSNGPTVVGNGDFSSRFGWYVNQINAKMAASWNRYEVDPRTPHGSRVYLIFTIDRDGSPSNVQLDRSSGSPTLDLSCERGVQRVGTFGPLPAAYNQGTLKVSYYCEY